MKVIFILLIAADVALSIDTKKETDDYSPSTPNPTTALPEPQNYSQNKYQHLQPSYVVQSNTQAYTPTQQFNYVVPQTYKFLPPPQINYIPLQHQQKIVQYTPDQNQSVHSTRIQNNIQTTSIPQKIIYSQSQSQGQPQSQSHPAQPLHYSLAEDVSSFKYQSPFVTYSNQGVLQQNLPKSNPSLQQYSQRSLPAQQAYKTPHVVYKPTTQVPQVETPQSQQIYAQQGSTTSILYQPQIQHTSAQIPTTKLIYSQPPQIYQTRQPQYVHQQENTKHASASAPRHFVYTVPQQTQQEFVYTPTEYSSQEAAHTISRPVYVITPQQSQATSQYQTVPQYRYY